MNSKVRLRIHAPLIHSLSTSQDPETLCYLLKHLNTSQLSVVTDLVRNFLNGNIPVSTQELKHLKSKKRILYRLASAKHPREKRKFIKQVGTGVFSILIPALASILFNILRN
jgi:GMP synthase PP-ATPase subunit